jgi:hypothetical protein
MLDRSNDPKAKHDLHFSANTKCCTYMPDLPNFLIGLILSDDSSEFAAGRALFERQVLQWAVITPLGAYRPPNYWAEYVRTFQSFGNNDGLRCPYYMHEQGGLCAIWLYRNSRCTTWFCKYDRYSVGVIFWKSMEFLLLNAEKALVQWCILNLGLEDSLSKLFPPGGQVDPRVSWGPWTGREREFFIECGKMVSKLTWEEVRLLGGTELHLREKILKQAYSKLQNPKLPERLKHGNFNGKYIGDDMYRVWAYNKLDGLDVPKKIYDLIPEFNGRSVNKILHSIEKNHGVSIDDSMLQKLIETMILIPA